MLELKRLSVVLALVISIGVSSCYTLDHTVGKGAQGSQEEEKRVWYALWGLVPLGDFDSQQLAGGATDYDVQSQQTFLDIVINLFTTWVTITSQTVTVTK